MYEVDVERINERLAEQTPVEILSWASATFHQEIAVSSSFQTQSVPLLHMVSQACPELPVLFLDTGFHFPETLAFRDQLVQLLGLNLRVLHCRIGHDAFMGRYGTLFRSDPDLCCYLNKVEPLARALSGQKAWIAGIRRDQTVVRRDTPILELETDGLYKISPLAAWTDSDVDAYIRAHELPVHPLTRQGYPSIGCEPCTRAIGAAADRRAGRWADTSKVECGIHEVHWRTRTDRGPTR